MTFSIAGVCQQTGAVGCAITSSSICVPSRCAFAANGVGVCLTQNITNPNLGPLGLQYLSDSQHAGDGANSQAELVMAKLQQAELHSQWRQLGVLSATGDGAVFSGSQALGIYNEAIGKNCIAMGNLLANDTIPQTMVDSFSSASGHLAERLLVALEAGLQAGGEMGPVHSAGLLVYAQESWPVVDLRVDWHEQPIAQLRHIWGEYQPQMQAYITRAKQPDQAESYGVPGDE